MLPIIVQNIHFVKLFLHFMHEYTLYYLLYTLIMYISMHFMNIFAFFLLQLYKDRCIVGLFNSRDIRLTEIHIIRSTYYGKGKSYFSIFRRA